MSQSTLSEALGFKNMWGFSPAIDLTSNNNGYNNNEDSSSSQNSDMNGDNENVPSSTSPINILLINPCDIRHIMKTLAARAEMSSLEDSAENKRPIHFYLIESHVEGLAKDLLMLHLFLDESIPIRQRAILFLEIYGNALVQEKTEAYIETMGTLLRSWICNELDCDTKKDSGIERAFLSIIDLKYLKYREKDDIESVFRRWNRSTEFDVTTLREYRMRHYFGDRYDSRRNLIDWDYHSNVTCIASIIHLRQYRDWRLSGVAYEYGDTVYSKPNRTCASNMEGIMKSGAHVGTKRQILGYWMDIVVSPYVTFGIDCDRTRSFADSLFHVINQGTGNAQHRYHAAEIATYNIVSMMFAVQRQEKYQMRQEGDIYSGLGALNSETDPIDESIRDGLSSRSKNFIISHENYKVFPISGSSDIKRLTCKEKFKRFFDILIVSQQSLSFMEDKDTKNLLKTGAKIFVETPKFIFPLRKKSQENIQKGMTKIFEEQKYTGVCLEGIKGNFYCLRQKES